VGSSTTVESWTYGNADVTIHVKKPPVHEKERRPMIKRIKIAILPLAMEIDTGLKGHFRTT
jgi:hypothetical protein